MARKLLTVDEFRSSAKDGTRPEGTVVHMAVADPEAAVDSRKIRFVFSDGSVDRAGDSINPAGWDLASFLKNPVALWAHDSFSPPIGRASNVGPSAGKLMGDIEFMPPEISAFADSVYRMVKGGYVKAVSVGFIPHEWTFVSDKDRPFGIDFEKQELLEISVCPVPCNPNALQEARAKGIDTAPLREWAERVLDGGGQVLIPRTLLEETFRQAKTPLTVRRQYLAKAEEANWKVGAARDLPTDDSDAWDGPAASKRMLDDAGFDGDSPDAAKAARGFLIHDAANPTLRGSYKFPFADVIGGTLKAKKGGIHAASTRLNDAPSDLQAEMKGIIEGYDKKFGDGKSAAVPITGGNLPPTCGRAKSAECGMKDPVECAVHAPPADNKNTPAPKEKSGRRISSANEALLREAMDHHASATKCIKDVLDSNTTDDGTDDPTDLTVPIPDEAKQRAERLREAKALKASIPV